MQYLKEIIELLQNQNSMETLIIPNIENFINMIKYNIFRPLPIVKKQGLQGETGVEDEEILVDPSWSHLQPVYDIFLQLIVSEQIEMRLLRTFIN